VQVGSELARIVPSCGSTRTKNVNCLAVLAIFFLKSEHIHAFTRHKNGRLLQVMVSWCVLVSWTKPVWKLFIFRELFFSS